MTEITYTPEQFSQNYDLQLEDDSPQKIERKHSLNASRVGYGIILAGVALLGMCLRPAVDEMIGPEDGYASLMIDGCQGQILKARAPENIGGATQTQIVVMPESGIVGIDLRTHIVKEDSVRQPGILNKDVLKNDLEVSCFRVDNPDLTAVENDNPGKTGGIVKLQK